MVGFADDLGALMMEAAVIAAHIKTKHRQQARQKLREYFRDQAEADDATVSRHHPLPEFIAAIACEEQSGGDWKE